MCIPSFLWSFLMLSPIEAAQVDRIASFWLIKQSEGKTPPRAQLACQS